ncbi:PepSY domain-containing protein [Ferrovibrio terrae]|uniref:PepSY domain-containing protein n=1 Tax=Ferrovibrio terrae TaxID=2594003 RepID=A0A516H1X8_9PROT|nr:PepSY-associated TM helix domain-containing protein [Ferrovibrio terrae]QDO97777.1 PepSY domain-containing protein [Ferrovibrio terrae]
MTLRQFWRRLHLWIGLAGGIIFVLLGLTGSALVYQDEILSLLYPRQMRVTVSETAAPSRILTAAQSALPAGDGRVVILRYPENPGRPIQALIEHGGERRTLLVDPANATLLGPLPGGEIFSVLLELHSRLMLQALGREIVGWVGVVLAISAITGLILWWPQPRLRAWKQALQLKWRNMSWQRRSFDLHKVMGSVIAMPMLLIALSGSALTFREPLLPLMTALGGIPQARPAVRPMTLENARSLDALVDEALRQIPGARLVFISPPARPGGATRIRLRQPDEIHQNGRSYVLLDAAGTVLDLQRVSELPAANLVFDQLPYPLHTGYMFGEAGRFVVFMAGILPLLLFVTGLVLWLRRR